MGSGLANKYGDIFNALFNEVKDVGGWADDTVSTVAVFIGKQPADVNQTPACLILPGPVDVGPVALRRLEHSANFVLHIAVDDQDIQNGLNRVIDRAEDVYDKLERNTLGTVLGGSEYITIRRYTPSLEPYESLTRHWTTVEVVVNFTTEPKNT
tara:strand:- start:1667 stop:2128 length:462 start_codon:yes stop_codon:yes gene_type:complete